jgi:hypothetical protein
MAGASGAMNDYSQDYTGSTGTTSGTDSDRSVYRVSESGNGSDTYGGTDNYGGTGAYTGGDGRDTEEVI